VKSSKVIALLIGLSFFSTALAFGRCSELEIGNPSGTSGEAANLAAAQCSLPEETTKVATIYFAGTGLTEEWWDPRDAVGTYGFGFWTRESVATLHKWQKTSDMHKKKFINGVGTGCANGDFDLIGYFAELVQQGWPKFELCRGWETNLQDAESFLRYDVLAGTSDKVILNLIGLSRGGVLTMRFANRIYARQDLRERIERINIIAFEPAAGDSTLPPSEFMLNPLVSQYVGMYAEDERAQFFSPAVPGFQSPETRFWMFTVPGAHETLVGNIQADGHHTNLNWTPCNPIIWPFGGECFDARSPQDGGLLKVSWVTTFIATKLLGSPHWGNVEFDTRGLAEWHGGLTSDADFKLNVDGLRNWAFTGPGGTFHYQNMRAFTVNPVIGYEGCERGTKPAQIHVWFGSVITTLDRCVDQFIHIENGDGIWWRNTFHQLELDGLTQQLSNGQAALAKLQELGFPDRDDDGKTDSQDNCPTTSNPDQADVDCDRAGDVCDDDDDNDGVTDVTDNCHLVANADQLDFDGDGQGDACDADDDNDDVLDVVDNCQFTTNTDQLNLDGDGQGDACDTDDDNDGLLDSTDNCGLLINPDQLNFDGDAQGDACDADDDNDGVVDTKDNCQFAANADQSDFDGDGQGDACDDAIAPANLRLMAPSAGQAALAVITLRATADDNSGTVQRIEFFMDSDGIPACSDATPKPSGSIFQCSWDTARFTNGTHKVSIRAHDAEGNVGTTTVAIWVNNPTEFSIAPSQGWSASASVSAGGTASYALAVAPTPGFTGSISFTCAGLPQFSISCMVSPDPATVSGHDATTIMVSIGTTARSLASGHHREYPLDRLAFLWTVALLLPGFVWTSSDSRRPKVIRNVFISAVVFALLLLLACGGGPSATQTAATGTPAGAYTVTLTGTSGAVTHSFDLNLVVN
jgi:hypothetical protein